MTVGSGSTRSNTPSIKYRCTPLEGPFFEVVEYDHENHVPVPPSSRNVKQGGEKSEPRSSEIISTSELISAVGLIWDYTSRPLAFLQPKRSLRHNGSDLRETNIYCYSVGEGNGWSISAESPCLPAKLRPFTHLSPMVQANFNFGKLSREISSFELCTGNYARSLFWRCLQGGRIKCVESCKDKSPETLGILYNWRNLYGLTSEVSLGGLKHQVDSTWAKSKETGDSSSGGHRTKSYCSSGNGLIPAKDMSIGSADLHNEVTKCMRSSSGQSDLSVAKISNATSLCSDYFLEPIQDAKANSKFSRNPACRLHADYNIEDLVSSSHVYEECEHKEDGQQTELITTDQPRNVNCSPAYDKQLYSLAKQEHAFAGALSGIFVSLCLHPIDTIKTVIQSCRADGKSIHHIGRSIILERGVTGLYRGIGSNITSSAPISAVYTFTYESVKAALLPFLPKEFQSLAHCTAGGCASIATSFIFTPSERIKQQMQIGSHYQSCWNAFIGIIQKGGVPSLFAGWGAVLCRNVPHSVIKFYTYESLKLLVLSSQESNAQPSTLQTLICGGLAGSTAALFTTPFDVVKTRLQTQIPGSAIQYAGVFDTLKEIGKYEGLKGLYRGLIPRLVMYISQGAIFFASYESFKKLLSSKVPEFKAKTIHYMQNMEDEPP